LVRRTTLADFARQWDLGRHLMMGHGEAETGGRNRAATLCAAFEAVVGALYLDQGLDSVQQAIEPLVIPQITRTLKERLDKDPKSSLQEIAQGRLHKTPRYRTVAESGPDHAKEFTVEATIGGDVYGAGKGHSKQEAAQEAARDALERFEKLALETAADEDPAPADSGEEQPPAEG
jgi:ribonuclease-3